MTDVAPRPTDIASWYADEEYVPGRQRRVFDERGVLVPEAPSGLAGQGRGVVLLPPTFLRPDRAQDFHISGASVLGVPFTAATTNPPIQIPGSQFNIPSTNVGVIRSLVLNVNTLLATSVIFWALRFDGVPVQGWEALTVFPRAAGSFALAFGPEETQIPVPEGAQIDVTIQVVDGAAYQAGATYGGWYYDRRIAEVFSDAWRV